MAFASQGNWGGSYLSNLKKEGFAMKKFACLSFAWVMVLMLLNGPAQAAKQIKIGIVDCYSGPPST